jgi:hypothetical protein
MIRFVVIACSKRGAIEPPEVLDDENQQIALERYFAGARVVGEIVCWRDGAPYVADLKNRRIPGRERLPRISAELRKGLTEGVMINEDSSIGQRWARQIRREGRTG